MLKTKITQTLRLILSIFLSLLVSLTSQAQTQDKYLFQTLETSDGLNSNSVSCLLADSKGYLWIGTDQGINRYNGYDVNSRFADTEDQQLNMLFNSHVITMQEDSEGRVWIECEDKFFIYDTKTARFSASADEILQGLGIPLDGKYRLKINRNGSVWVLTEKGIYHDDFRKHHLMSWEVANLPFPEAAMNVIAETSSGICFSAERALWQFDTNTAKLTKVAVPHDFNPSVEDIRVVTDADATLWVFSIQSDYICRYSVGGKITGEMVKLPEISGASKNNAIRDVIDDRQGNIWIATDHEGVFVYNKKTESITNITYKRDRLFSLASDNITCLEVDENGTLWVGHFKTGVSYGSDAYNFLRPHAAESGDILAMEYDSNGNLWLGTDGDGVYVEKKDGTLVKTAVPNITIMTLMSDGNGGMWAGAYNQGLYHFDNESRFTRYSTDDNSFPVNNVWTLARDGRGNIWASSALGKTVMFDEKTKAATIVRGDDSDILGTGFCLDDEGTMYIASVYGLWTYNPATKLCEVSFGNRKGTQQWLSQMINFVSVDTRRQMMVLGHQKGVTLYDMTADSLYYLNLNADIIKGIVRGQDSSYWICTSNGNVLNIKPERKAGALIPNTRNFMSRQNMMKFYFNSASIACSPQGNILMGGTDGYVSFNPKELISVKNNDRKLIISEIAVGDSLINENTTTVKLNHDAAYITVKFFDGTLGGMQRSRFAYRLVGQMGDWVVTDHNYVSFHGLPPGDYTLQLCVCREDGSRGEPYELKIYVSPPFFQSTAMIIVYILAALLAAYYVWRRFQQRQKERMEQQQQQMEHQKMEQITNMKLQFFTNISHDLSTPRARIVSPLEQIVNKMEDGTMPENLLNRLKTVRKNAQLLLGEVNDLLDFRRLDVGVESLNLRQGDIVDHLNSIVLSFSDYAEERNISLSFKHDTNSFIMDYDREKMSKVIYNLLSNALKFTPVGGDIELEFRGNPDTIGNSGTLVSIIVRDTGKGIPDSEKENIFKRFFQLSSNDSSQIGSGIGLHIAEEYVKLHDGTIHVSDNQPHGSVFTITLPVTRQAEPVPEINEENGQPVSSESEKAEENKPAVPAILVVDDNKDMLDFVSSCMEGDYQVFKATDGAMALDILRQEQVALVISDVMMPGVDGFELCRIMKSDIALSHIPVILLTARTTDVSRIEGLQLGADDYLTKPFNVEVLRLRVEKFMEWEKANHQKFRKTINIEPSEITITPLDEQLIQKMISLVEQHIDDSEFSVESLAAEVGMSRSTLYKKLMVIIGQGPAEFIRTIRIKRGKALLESSQMQITEIAYAVGFTTVKSFSMNFKAVYGMTPSEYLRSRK